MKLQTLSASVRFVDKPEAVSRQKVKTDRIAELEKAVDNNKAVFSED